MNNKEERVQCQKLWAKNKYLVLSHSSKIYLEIRTYLKQEEVSQNITSRLGILQKICNKRRKR